MNLHLYVQGLNLVTNEFKGKDWWAKGLEGKQIPYFKGRTVTCPNNPEFREFHQNRVKKAMQFNSDGIFIDNIQMGQLAFEHQGKAYTFGGCYCQYCQSAFREKYGNEIPTNFDKADQNLLTSYFEFVTNSVTDFISDTKKLTGKKEFGTNFYDPGINAYITYGFDISTLMNIQDYVLFEHFIFPNEAQGRIPQLPMNIESYDKPIFSLPYKKPIAFDSEYEQNDYDLLYSTYANTRISVCLKGSEFVTKKFWHNVDPSRYKKPKVKNIPISFIPHKTKLPFFAPLIPFSWRNYLQERTITILENSRFFRPLMRVIFRFIVR